MGFPGGSMGKESACKCKRHRRCGFNPWVGKIPWRRAWQFHSSILAGESHGQRSLVVYSPWGRKESGTMTVTTRIHINTTSPWFLGVSEWQCLTQKHCSSTRFLTFDLFPLPIFLNILIRNHFNSNIWIT